MPAPGLEYNFLFFNLNDLSEKAPAEMARKQSWFRSEKFRLAVSLAIDREAIVRLVYEGRGAALWGPVTPGECAVGKRSDSISRPLAGQIASNCSPKAGFSIGKR